MKNTALQKSKEANPRAISVRIATYTYKQVAGVIRHDLRQGRQPNYVDASRSDQNSVLVTPEPALALAQICDDRRDTRETKRRRKSDASVLLGGIITFGREAQVHMERLTHREQDAAFRAVATVMAVHLNTTISGLVVHRDESGLHAHLEMPAYCLDGRPVTKASSPAHLSKLQDIAAEAIKTFAPAIERGNRKRDRREAGASYSDTVHRSVRELHHDLPIELEEARRAMVEMQARVDALKAEVELSEAKKKRLAVYERRLAAREADLREVEKRLAPAEAAELEIVSNARKEADAILAEAKQKATEEREAARQAAQQYGAQAQAQAESLVSSTALVLADRVVWNGDARQWEKNGPLDVTEINNFKAGTRHPLWAKVQPALLRLVSAFRARIERLATLVTELEAIQTEMTAPQRKKLEDAKNECEGPEF